MGVCVFLLHPQLSSDAYDECECLRKKFQLPWGDLTYLFVWYLDKANMFYFSVVPHALDLEGSWK